MNRSHTIQHNDFEGASSHINVNFDYTQAVSFLAEQRTKRESTYSSKPVNSLGLLN